LGGKRDIGANESTLDPWRGNQWVFYGGISLLDVHGIVLWTSPKLVGPQMNFEDGWVTWDQNFNFPFVWFDSAAGARINRAHC
jgi:hypothetical protein